MGPLIILLKFLKGKLVKLIFLIKILKGDFKKISKISISY